MTRAEEAHAKIDGHELLCAERYAHIHTAISGVKETVGSIMKTVAWGGTTIFGLLVACLAFFATRAMTNNDAQVEKLESQIMSMQMHQGETGDRGAQGIPGRDGLRN